MGKHTSIVLASLVLAAIAGSVQWPLDPHITELALLVVAFLLSFVISCALEPGKVPLLLPLYAFLWSGFCSLLLTWHNLLLYRDPSFYAQGEYYVAGHVFGQVCALIAGFVGAAAGLFVRWILALLSPNHSAATPDNVRSDTEPN
jgi:hypothetical protein